VTFISFHLAPIHSHLLKIKSENESEVYEWSSLRLWLSLLSLKMFVFVLFLFQTEVSGSSELTSAHSCLFGTLLLSIYVIPHNSIPLPVCKSSASSLIEKYFLGERKKMWLL